MLTIAMNATDLARPAASEDPSPQIGTLAEAFARYQDELLGTLYYLLGNAEDARDALQEAFIKCWRHRDEEPDIQNLRAWIFRVALNTGKDQRKAAWRRRSRPFSKDEAMIETTQAGPAENVERAELLQRVRHAVHRLRSEEQEVFLLRQNGYMTYDQIAEVIGIPTGTVKTRMRMALTKLREALA